MRSGFAWMVPDPSAADVVVEAERCGVHSVWVPEMWGQDAFTPLAFLAAKTSTILLGTSIAQIGSRTPAALAMTAMSLQALSEGRFRLGLGTSGPQVMEGWHGVRFDAPVTTTRETIDVVRMIASGERLVFDGKVFHLPLPDSRGRAMRSMMAPLDVPIHLAALGPRNLRLTGEVADGWIGTSFMPETADVFLDQIVEGARVTGRSIADVELMVPVSFEVTDDVDEASKRHARGYAFTIGAMGTSSENFYNAAFERQGYGDDIQEVQRLWGEGEREKAAERVPVDIGFKTNLIGTPAMIKDRLRLYRDVGITTIQMKPSSRDLRQTIDDVAQFASLVAEVDAEVARS